MKIKKLLALAVGVYAFVGLVLALAMLLPSGSASAKPNQGKGGPNGVHVGFTVGSQPYDSYWMETGSGLLHEWRFNEPTGPDQGKDVHYIFKPADRFNMADCDSENLLRSFLWTANLGSYTDHTGDEAELEDYIIDGNQYWVCVYEEVE